MKRTVFIEAWRTSVPGYAWIGQVKDSENPQVTDYPASFYQSDSWDYRYNFNGRKANVLFVSRDVFTRDEALAISLLIVEGKGVKAWRIDLE